MLKLIRKLLIFCLLSLCFVCESNADPYAFDFAGLEYDISPDLLRAISKVESNHKTDAVNRNANGSYDVCHMQINSFWKEKLGYRWQLLDDPAVCTLVGAWILRSCIDRYGYDWNAIACYNTGYSIDGAPSKQKRAAGIKYVSKVRKALSKQ